MNDHHDPMLRSLFEAAERELDGRSFSADLMSRVGRSGRRSFWGWIGAALVAAACVWLFATSVQDIVALMTHATVIPLVNVDHLLLAFLISPINNIAAMSALGAIGLFVFYRMLFA